MIAVVYEDRPVALLGAQIAILSLLRRSPGLPVLAIVPDAPEWFVDWAAPVRGLTVRTDRDGITGSGWDVKPSVLQFALAEGHSAALWFDSDLVATADIRPRLDAVPPETVIATEEYFWGHHQNVDVRTVGLGLRPARVFRATVNTCFLRVSRSHMALLHHWNEILTSDAYVQQQGDPSRPIHHHGDQEVLTGLLGSADWADVPVDQLARGAEIAQCFGPSGFTVRERLRSGRSLPLLVHAMGAKPWVPVHSSERGLRRARAGLDAIHRDLTPYVDVARGYREELHGDDAWLTPHTVTARVLTKVMPHRPAQREIPLAAIDSAQRWVRRRLDIAQVPAVSRA